MFVPTRHAREVRAGTLLKACMYALMPPQYNYIRKIKDTFGASSLQYLNSESFLHDLLKMHPMRVPGRRIAIEKRFEKRFSKLIQKSGLVPVIYSGQKELGEVVSDERVIVIIIPEAYDVSSRKHRTAYERSAATKVLFQSRKKPRTVSLAHDIFMWEPRGLPRAVAGTIVYIERDFRRLIWSTLIQARKNNDRISQREVLRHLLKALLWRQENRYRALNKKPAVIMARLVYDFL